MQSATEDEAASQFSKAIERTYDPFWGNARNLLDYLAANDLLQKDLAKAALGSFVLAKGSLSVLDLGMLKEAWKLPTVKRLIGLGAEQAQGLSRQQRRQADRQGNKEPNPSEFVMEMLGVMPHGRQALLTTPTAKIWCALQDDAFVTRPADITCNHGITVSGEWALLGLLDAVPDDGVAEPESQPLGDNWVGGPASLVGNLATVVQPLVRQLLGRPRTFYGVTPLLVLRDVT